MRLRELAVEESDDGVEVVVLDDLELEVGLEVQVLLLHRVDVWREQGQSEDHRGNTGQSTVALFDLLLRSRAGAHAPNAGER